MEHTRITHAAGPDGAAGDAAAVQGPAWDLGSEYSSLDSDAWRADMKAAQAAIDALEAAAAPIAARVETAAALDPRADAKFLDECRRFAVASEAALVILNQLGVYASCVSSVDGSDAAAKAARGVIQAMGSRFDAVGAAFNLVMVLCPDAFFDSFCSTPDTARFRFMLAQERKFRARALPLPAEKAVATLGADGFHAWSTLYDSITGSLRCTVRGPDGVEKAMGLSQAASLLKRPEPEVRKAAWNGINAALSGHADTMAAILNSLSGWRHAENGLRSHTEKVHYLDTALKQSRISKATLDALMGTLREAREIGRRALRLQARLYGVERLGPWDILAPAPARGGSSSAIPFDEGLATVHRAYASVDPSMGTFVDSMARSRRIEGRVKDGKRPGAYCTEFPRSRNPFVYTTYQGALSELSTLAHELGHAYHCEVMRDIPLAESNYPMTLAETASTFAETVLGDLLETEAKDEGALLNLAWSDAQDAATMLVNIPARFEFESRFYERRPSGPVGPEALRELMRGAWKEWYGDALSDYDEWYWASKLHFHKSGTSFYNFPYSFGYLFSLGVYARREELGPRFHPSYVALLRDTGRMEAEELAMRHLGVDLTKPDFWKASVRIVERKVDRFEKLAAKFGPTAS